MECAFCGTQINISDKITRTDTCPNCSEDLRCCKHCDFYESHAYNECKEVMAKRIVDKEKANFCDYYVAKDSSQKKVNRAQDARNALEALFKK